MDRAGSRHGAPAATRFGTEVLAIGVLMFLAPLVIQLRSLSSTTDVSPTKRSLRMVVSAAVSLPVIVGGALLMAGSDAGLYWIAAGVILSLVSGVYGAWVLLDIAVARMERSAIRDRRCGRYHTTTIDYIL